MKGQSGEVDGRIQALSNEVTPCLHKLNLNILFYSFIYIIAIELLYSQLFGRF